MRLSLATLDRIRPGVTRPPFDPARLGTGIVHLGIGAFHRAHQGVFTEDAVIADGGAWGITGVSLRRPDVPATLVPQDGLYTVETLDTVPRYRVMGIVRQALTATAQQAEVLAALAAPTTHVVTLTVTEKGYVRDPARPAVPGRPWTAMDWLVEGLALRHAAGTAPFTVVSCDNLQNNGEKLRAGVIAIAQERDAALARWIATEIGFPNTMIDSIVPATDAASAARVAAAIGMIDHASVQREPFGQWAIEDRFTGPRPAWDKVGVDIVADVTPFERLKLHVLNATHSTLAYMGLARGHLYVLHAIADPGLLGFVERLVHEEIAPALAPLDVAAYWRTVHARYENPMVDHALEQIAQDGSAKLAQRLFPLLTANARNGLPTACMAKVVDAWLAFARSREHVIDPQAAAFAAWRTGEATLATAVADPALFPDAFRNDRAVRSAMGLADT
ncbi:mannitol dehydrogenase family protein [Sphingobium algorifonticola]|nr:mannitol dehydrogenase family protein [Sphingobium algorifonticola]